MVQLLEPPFWIEEEAPPPPLAMPRVLRQPAVKRWQRGRLPVHRLVLEAARGWRAGNPQRFAKAHGELTAEFQPAIQWALSSWEYLLSTEGCRFLLRPPEEKRYCRGDYRAFLETDFQALVYRTFKTCLNRYVLETPPPAPFEAYLRRTLWPTLRSSYRALENPPDPRQRRLTAYSYLRCIPYQFINRYHQERVYARVEALPRDGRQVVRLYYLQFRTEAAVQQKMDLSASTFELRRASALASLARNDFLSYQLLLQIERY